MKGDYLILKKVIMNLKYYKTICKITLDDIEGKYTFAEVVNNLIAKRKLIN